jgi:hypothetical protein
MPRPLCAAEACPPFVCNRVAPLLPPSSVAVPSLFVHLALPFLRRAAGRLFFPPHRLRSPPPAARPAAPRRLARRARPRTPVVQQARGGCVRGRRRRLVHTAAPAAPIFASPLIVWHRSTMPPVLGAVRNAGGAAPPRSVQAQPSFNTPLGRAPAAAAAPRALGQPHLYPTRPAARTPAVRPATHPGPAWAGTTPCRGGARAGTRHARRRSFPTPPGTQPPGAPGPNAPFRTSPGSQAPAAPIATHPPRPARARARPAGARPITAAHCHHRRIATSATATLSPAAPPPPLPSLASQGGQRMRAAPRLPAASRPPGRPARARSRSRSAPAPRRHPCHASATYPADARDRRAARREDPFLSAAHFPCANEPCRRRAGQRRRPAIGPCRPLASPGARARARRLPRQRPRPPPAVPSVSQTPSPPWAAASLAAPRAPPASARPKPNPSLTCPALPAAAPRCTGNPFGNASGMSAPALLTGVNPVS